MTCKILILVFLAFTRPLATQWVDHRDPQTPRKNGQPELAAPAPHMNGKPDISGVWRAERALYSEIASVLGSEAANLEIDVGKY
jgi:hypothetical protein